jgi:signal transduction histidine kinase
LVAPLYLTGMALLALLGYILALQVVGLLGIASIPRVVGQVAGYVALAPFGLLPYVFLAGLAKTRITRGGNVGRLVERLGAAPPPGEVRDALADALRDPSLDLAYWVPEAERWVDSHGRPYELPGPGSGRAVTDVDLEGKHVAAIVHDPSLDEDREMVRAAGGAAALALENERLEAELRAKVDELRTSRERLIEVGLTERQTLERNLHDGAQQRLVSLALQLRMARAAMSADPETASEALDTASGELDQALGELRELARGIHPAVLSDRGLSAALESLARRAPLPVAVEHLPEERLPPPVELAAYYVVSEALTNVVKYAHASRADVQVARNGQRVTVQVRDDGVGGADPVRGTGLQGLADRVGALDGRLEVDSERGRGTVVRARIPCG